MRINTILTTTPYLPKQIAPLYRRGKNRNQMTIFLRKNRPFSKLLRLPVASPRLESASVLVTMHFKDYLLRPKDPLVFSVSVSSLNLQSSPTNSKSSKFSLFFNSNEKIYTSTRLHITLTHSLTHSLTQSLTHSLTHSSCSLLLGYSCLLIH